MRVEIACSSIVQIIIESFITSPSFTVDLLWYFLFRPFLLILDYTTYHHMEKEFENNPPRVPLARVELDDGLSEEKGHSESWNASVRSVDSATSTNFKKTLETLNFHSNHNSFDEKLNDMGMKRATTQCSSASSLVSESFVDATQAGILGISIIPDEGKLNISEGIAATQSTSSLPLSRDNLPANGRVDVAQSVFTDPGATIGAENNIESKKEQEARNASSYGRTIGEDHVNFILMYDMLTGIRHSVSVCQAKPSRPLTEQDFRYARTYNFLPSSNDTTPSKYEFRFKDYCPWVFRSLREAFRIDAADYLVSLTGKYVLSEIGSPGKSGSFFYFSQDFRYIIKTIKQQEHEFLRKILQNYYEHIRRNPNSLLTRFYGLHRVRMSNIKKIYFVVMGNVFPPHKDIHETYDLKGSTKGRFVTAEELVNKNLATLKDLNWIQRKRKLKLGPEKATLFINQLNADCNFLTRNQIMDYSLLLGIHYMSRGNKDNLRGKSMKMLEPTSPLPGERGILTTVFKSSMIKTAPSSDPIPQEKRMCMFCSEDGGFRSSNPDGSAGEELYFLGIIDILTPYSVKKRLEHVLRSIKDDARSISAISPDAYAKRFIEFMRENILLDSESDYATKKLPVIPETYAIFERAESIVIEDRDHPADLKQ